MRARPHILVVPDDVLAPQPPLLTLDRGQRARARSVGRRIAKTEAKLALAQAEAAPVGGYVCPKCFARWNTAAARAGCRASHREA